MNIKELLVEFLRNAIKGGAMEASALKVLSSQENLATLFKVSKKHDVAHLVAHALEKNGFSLDCASWQVFLEEKEQAVLRYEMMQVDINEICACFNSEGIDYIPLKGAVVRKYYPEPWMRTSCDIDILVHEADLDRAVNALVSSHSYRVDGKKTYHDISLYSPFGMHLELHHNIKETIDKYDKLLTQVWVFSQKTEQNGYKHLQSNEFLMLHLTAHMAYHFIGGGCGLRSVLDMWLLKEKLELDNEVLNGFLKETELDKFYKAITELGDYWFGQRDSVSQTVLETEKLILLGGVYGTKKQGAVSKQIKKGGKFKYFWSRIFMPYESLAILYPIIKKHKILTPFCQIARWFGTAFKSKRIKNEIKNVTSVSQEQAESVRVLLNDLGL